MRYLGLDLGTKTLGISISDRTNMIASPLITLRFPENDFQKVIPDLQKIIHENDITELVLGLPKNMNNTLGFAAERSLEFKKLLDKDLSIPVHMVDERLTTKEAENILISSNKTRKQRKKVIDNVASSLILDTYLKERNLKNE